MKEADPYCLKCGWMDWFKRICPECGHDKVVKKDYSKT